MAAMPGVLAKLNLKSAGEILVLEAPASFEKELPALGNIRVIRTVREARHVTFAIAFVTQKARLERIWKVLAAKAVADAVIWFAYPKVTSRRYRADLNRDEGWDCVREGGWDSVRQIAIDEDWSALRFRRREFINRRAAPR